jgi:uncharacterized protein DUF5118
MAAAAVAVAQDDPATPAAGAAGGRGAGAAALPPPNPQPFDRVINKEAKAKKGLFTVYQVGDRFYYEIPKKELGEQYLGVRRKSDGSVGFSFFRPFS